MSKKQTAVEWLSDKLVEILGDKCNELTQEQTLANHYAIKQALQMEKQQIIDFAYDWYNINERSEKPIEPRKYYTQTYGECTQQ